MIFFSKTTITELAFVELLKIVRTYIQRLGHEVKALRSDYAKAFMAKATMDYLEKECIVSQSSASYSHFQNSVERDVETIIKKALAILLGQLWLRPDAWAMAVKHIVDIGNHMPRSGRRTSTLYQLEKMTVDQRYTF
jgi:hypothetical protein